MKIAIHGRGRMGTLVEAIATERGHEVAAIFAADAPISASRLQGIDVVVDFSHASAIDAVVGACCEAGVALVTGTTGWDGQRAAIDARVRDAAIGFVAAANFSPGATIAFALAREAARLTALFGGYEAGIEERHHAKKKDSPSGTALRLAKEVREGSDGLLNPQIAASRAGAEVGLHTVFFDSADDLVEISHRARSREGFARGAIVAAERIAGRAGVWTFEELVAGG
ncbi:MAG: 4-hydroxy-tetrahydrodipicolinate reductase [Acidobacteria bacterium]|nr:4-hydroxy-tetrahydrodipicolinate reductase [Acidobacteriota bacterium]